MLRPPLPPFFFYFINMQYHCGGILLAALKGGEGGRVFSTQFVIPSEIFQRICMYFVFHLYFLLKLCPLAIMVTFVSLSKIQRRLSGVRERKWSWNSSGRYTTGMLDLWYEVANSILPVEFGNHMGLYAAQSSVKSYPYRPCTQPCTENI